MEEMFLVWVINSMNYKCTFGKQDGTCGGQPPTGPHWMSSLAFSLSSGSLLPHIESELTCVPKRKNVEAMVLNYGDNYVKYIDTSLLVTRTNCSWEIQLLYCEDTIDQPAEATH